MSEAVLSAVSSPDVGCRGAEPLSAKVLETLAACLQCGACAEVCPAGLRVDAIIRDARAALSSGHPWPKWLWWVLQSQHLLPFLGRLAFIVPRSSGLLRRLLWLESGTDLSAEGRAALSLPTIAPRPALAVPSVRALAPGLGETARGRPRIAFFLGCVQNYFYPEVVEAVTGWFGADLIVPQDQGCCGLPAWSAGAAQATRNLALRHLASFQAVQPDYVLTACASCAGFLSRLWHGVIGPEDPGYEAARSLAGQVREFSQLVVELGVRSPRVRSEGPRALAYHAPCHQRFALADGSAPEAVLAGFPGADPRVMEPGCCGQGGLFGLGHPGLSRAIFEHRLDAWRRTGAPVVVTTCSGCLFQWRVGSRSIPVGPRVCHLAEVPFMSALHGS